MLKESSSYEELKKAKDFVSNPPLYIPREVLNNCTLMMGNFSKLSQKGDTPTDTELDEMFFSLGMPPIILRSTRTTLVSGSPEVYLQLSGEGGTTWGTTKPNIGMSLTKPKLTYTSNVKRDSIHSLRLAKRVDNNDEFIFI